MTETKKVENVKVKRERNTIRMVALKKCVFILTESIRAVTATRPPICWWATCCRETRVDGGDTMSLDSASAACVTSGP